mgnify:CR=1 FL=1
MVIVAFNSADVILGCVESLMNSEGPRPHVVVVDNASPDATVALLEQWASGRAEQVSADDLPFDPGVVRKPLKLARFRRGDRPVAAELGDVAILEAGANRGFAGGVNLGLELLAGIPEVRHFWVLNPDTIVAPGAVQALLAAADRMPEYGLMGGRVLYAEAPHRVQIDGGRINRWTGVTHNVNLGADPAAVPPPRGEDLDFIMGANLVASRAFYDRVGPMREDYFLYYEEADWAMRRGDMPLVVAPGFVIWHHAGTAIGSPTLERLASPFSFWFKYRSRMKFIRRFNPVGLPVAMAYATAKAGQLLLKGAWPQAGALLRATWGLPAPRSVRERLSPEAARIAFSRARR